MDGRDGCSTAATTTTADRVANAISDALNAAVPWLWWPLQVPPRDRLLGPPHHVLYAAHAVLIDRAARRTGLRLPVPSAALLALGSWAWFTGAWNRRAVALAGRST